MASSSSFDQFKIISTKYGPIRGKLETALFFNRHFFAFRGIPYAKHQRFMSPESPDAWSEVRDSFVFGNRPVQYYSSENRIDGDEDCLFLNVYMPAAAAADGNKYTVMVYIHGGGYNVGCSDLYGPDFLVGNDVLLVTINYRQGPLGFATFDEPLKSGNMGLKDQLAAMKWVYENIETFHGDRNNLTLFGESAGSASVQFHLLSPTSRKYFKRCILQSGSSLNPWALYRPPSSGNDSSEARALCKSLSTAPAEELMKRTYERFHAPGAKNKTFGSTWGPIVEDPKSIDPIIVAEPEETMKNLKPGDLNVDILIGYTSAEMLESLSYEIKDPTLLAPFNDAFQVQLPWLCKNNCVYIAQYYIEIMKKARQFYFQDRSVDGNTLAEFSNLLSDICFVYGIDCTVKLLRNVNSGSIYYYVFDMDTIVNFIKEQTGAKAAGLAGTAHCDDLYYIFRMNDFDYKKLDPLSQEVQAIKRITKIWTNFAKYGDPNLESSGGPFKPVTNDTVHYAKITNDKIVYGTDPFSRSIKLWTELHEYFNRKIREEV